MSIREWLSSEMRRDVFQPVSSADAEKWMTDKSSKDLIDAVYTFGTLMLTEMNGRMSAVDGKATSILGWSSAALAFLLIDQPWLQTLSWFEVLLVVFSVLAASNAALMAGLALRLRKWPWPSERDWFQHTLFDDPVRLRTFYTATMLKAHRESGLQSVWKAWFLTRAQWSLVAAILLIGGMTLVHAVARFLALLV